MYTKNVSQLLLVHSGYHTPTFQHAEKPTYKRERFALFLERQFKCGRLNESSNKANAFNNICLQTFGLRCKGSENLRNVQEKSHFGVIFLV
jgi:hypothetical protein